MSTAGNQKFLSLFSTVTVSVTTAFIIMGHAEQLLFSRAGSKVNLVYVDPLTHAE